MESAFGVCARRCFVAIRQTFLNDDCFAQEVVGSVVLLCCETYAEFGTRQCRCSGSNLAPFHSSNGNVAVDNLSS